MLFLTAGSRFSEKRDKLYIDIIDDFSNEKMRSYFQIPHYALLAGKVQRFKEARDITLLEVTYNKETQSFYIPAGYQKIDKKLFHQNVQIVTTQHIVEHVLADYYKRKNSFIVANTFQILEYLSRAMFAKLKGFHEEAGRFIKAASCCKGQYPDSNLDEVLQKKSESYPIFASEFAYNMFFRSPLLK
jgi:hypothetical protein